MNVADLAGAGRRVRSPTTARTRLRTKAPTAAQADRYRPGDVLIEVWKRLVPAVPRSQLVGQLRRCPGLQLVRKRLVLFHVTTDLVRVLVIVGQRRVQIRHAQPWIPRDDLLRRHPQEVVPEDDVLNPHAMTGNPRPAPAAPGVTSTC